MTAQVVRLIDRAAGFPCEDMADLADWLTQWAEGMKAGDFGRVMSLCVVVENENGHLGVISQSIATMDLARVVGMLTLAAHRKADGRASMTELEP